MHDSDDSDSLKASLAGLRVAMLVPGPLDNSGGVELSALRLLRSLEDMGADCHVVWRQRKGVAPLHEFASKPIPDVRIGKVFNRFLFGWRAGVAATRLQAEVLHVQSLEYAWPLLFLSSWAQLRRKPVPVVVVTSHGSLSTLYARTAVERPVLNRVLSKLFFALEALALARADVVVSVSEHAGRDVRRRGFRGPLVVVPNAVEVDTFTPSEVRAVPGQRLVWTGRDAAYKNPRAALAVMTELNRTFPGVQLIMVGPGLQYKGWNVDCVGRLPQSDVAELLRGAYAFISTSRYEGDPLAVKEALACGVPAVVTAAASQGVEDGRNGIVVPNDLRRSKDVERFAVEVGRLLSDQDLRDRLAEGARASRPLLAPAHETRSYRDLYLQILQIVISRRESR